MLLTKESQDVEIERLIKILKSNNLAERNIAAKALGDMKEAA
jgi:hypothetical protein